MQAETKHGERCLPQAWQRELNFSIPAAQAVPRGLGRSRGSAVSKLRAELFYAFSSKVRQGWCNHISVAAVPRASCKDCELEEASSAREILENLCANDFGECTLFLLLLAVTGTASSSQAVACTKSGLATKTRLGGTAAFTADPRDFQFSIYLLSSRTSQTHAAPKGKSCLFSVGSDLFSACLLDTSTALVFSETSISIDAHKTLHKLHVSYFKLQYQCPSSATLPLPAQAGGRPESAQFAGLKFAGHSSELRHTTCKRAVKFLGSWQPCHPKIPAQRKAW